MDERRKRQIISRWLVAIIVATAIGSFIGTIRHNTVLGFIIAVALDLLVGLLFAFDLRRQ